MRANNWISFGCGLAAIAIGVAIAVMLSDIATVKAGWCEARPSCLRDWIGALSGWAAAVGALATIWVLWRTLTHMRLTAEQQLRAYVHIDHSDLIDVETGAPRAQFSVKNFGQTPAVSVFFTGSIDLLAGDFHRRCQIFGRYLGTLPPHHRTRVMPAIPMIDYEAWILVSKRNDARVQFQVTITHSDAFGKTWTTVGAYSARAPLISGTLLIDEITTGRAHE